jgi:hypothetical protein
LVARSLGDPGGVDRDTRREENQKMFRGGNAALRDAAKKIGHESAVPFMCECASVDCRSQVEVTAREWEAVAARPNHYLMILGHERSEGEEIAGHLGEYQVARKPG